MNLDPADLRVATIQHLPPIEERLWIMGIRVPDTPEWDTLTWGPHAGFAWEILHGPRHCVVRRREEDRRRRLFHVRSLMVWYQRPRVAPAVGPRSIPDPAPHPG